MATRTARYCITRAFRFMGLISEDEGLTADQASEALSIMNDMMNGWNAEGIQYVHSDLTLDTTVNVPDELVESTWLMLASALADDYGKVFTDKQQRRVDGARNNLQAYYFKVPPAQTDEGLRPNWPPGYFDISRG
jgi:hypothetical protein